MTWGSGKLCRNLPKIWLFRPHGACSQSKKEIRKWPGYLAVRWISLSLQLVKTAILNCTQVSRWLYMSQGINHLLSKFVLVSFLRSVLGLLFPLWEEDFEGHFMTFISDLYILNFLPEVNEKGEGTLCDAYLTYFACNWVQFYTHLGLTIVKPKEIVRAYNPGFVKLNWVTHLTWWSAYLWHFKSYQRLVAWSMVSPNTG